MKKNRLFPLKFEEQGGAQLANIAIENPSVLWHLRYGHLNYVSLKLLTSQDMIFGLPKVEEHKEVCEGCALGKDLRKNFPRGEAWRESHPLQLVNSDICGPMQTKSMVTILIFLPS